MITALSCTTHRNGYLGNSAHLKAGDLIYSGDWLKLVSPSSHRNRSRSSTHTLISQEFRDANSSDLGNYLPERVEEWTSAIGAIAPYVPWIAVQVLSPEQNEYEWLIIGNKIESRRDLFEHNVTCISTTTQRDEFLWKRICGQQQKNFRFYATAT
jgi:hypothetical protein